jgi:hypothetical protein
MFQHVVSRFRDVNRALDGTNAHRNRTGLGLTDDQAVCYIYGA